MLSTLVIHDQTVQKLKVFGKSIAISQLADDTTLFLKNKDQVPLAISLVNVFSKASGLQLNLSKCELLSLHQSDSACLHNIPVKDKVKYLGIIVTKDQKISTKENFDNNLQKANRVLNCWLQRDISIFGRILLTKVEYLSRLIYPAFSLAPPSNFIKVCSQKMFNFIWKHKAHYIKKTDTTKSYEQGGLNVIEFENMNILLKLKWLKMFLCKEDSFWFTVPSALFQEYGGIKFFLKCDFDLSKLPVKLSTFHQQVLLFWKLAHTHNFTPHNASIWNNKYILHRNRSLCYKNWLNRSIWSVRDLMDEQGNILDYNAFTLKHGFACHPKEFFIVVNAIPSGIKMLMKSSLSYSEVKPVLPALYIGDFQFKSDSCTNKYIRQVILKTCYPCQVKRNKLDHMFDKNTVTYLRTAYLKFPVPPKAKEIHFKILNEIYPSYKFLNQKFNIEMVPCSFCESQSEDTDHIFFLCNFSKLFWISLQDWLIEKEVVADNFVFSLHHILFGVPQDCCVNSFLLNNIVILAKYFIHKCRFFKSPPLLIVFKNDLKCFSKALNKMKGQSAMKLLYLLTSFNLL